MDGFLSTFFVQCTYHLEDHLNSQVMKKTHDLNLRKELQTEQLVQAHEKTVEAIEKVPLASHNELQELIQKEAKSMVLKMRYQERSKNKSKNTFRSKQNVENKTNNRKQDNEKTSTSKNNVLLTPDRILHHLQAL